MTVAPVIPAAVVRDALVTAGRRVREARDELGALDAAAGDGDLGVTLDHGFAVVEEALGGSAPGDDIGATLRRVGLELARSAPSTIGTLLASGFLRAGKELAGCSELGPAEVVTLFSASAAGVAERGRAEPGERTVLDSMGAAAGAAEAVAGEGGSALDVIAAAATGASDGAEATAEMEPQHGRAGWIRERAQGSKDAGAVAWCVFARGLADACATWNSNGRRPPQSTD